MADMKSGEKDHVIRQTKRRSFIDPDHDQNVVSFFDMSGANRQFLLSRCRFFPDDSC